MKYSYIITIVNDGSTDNTENILRKWENNKNIKIINQENKGHSGARNTALENICGKYLLFVDSDDYIDAVGVEHILNKAINNDLDIVQGSFCRIDDNDKIYKIEKKMDKTYEEALGNLSGFMWGKIIKSNFFEMCSMPENFWFEDSIMAHIIFPQTKKVATMSDVVYYYRNNPNSITNTHHKFAKSLDSLYITLNLFKERKKIRLPINQAYYEYILRNIKLTFKRTENLGEDVRKNIFIVWCEFIENEFCYFETKDKNNKYIEKAIKEHNYGLYECACRYL